MYDNRNVIVLIMAAGSGVRLGSEVPKQFLDVGGEPMIVRSARAFENCPQVDGIYAVVAEEYVARTDELLGVLSKYRGSVVGADVRQESVRLGLHAVIGGLDDGFCGVGWDGDTLGAGDRGRSPLRDGCKHIGNDPIVLIHDAARPFVTQKAIAHVIMGVSMTGAAISCVPVTDTIYEAGGVPECGRPLFLEDSPDRETLWSVQTPQGFDMQMIMDAHDAAASDGFEATDDGMVAKKYGNAAVLIAMGDYANRKITTPSDMPLVGTIDTNDTQKAVDCEKTSSLRGALATKQSIALDFDGLLRSARNDGGLSSDFSHSQSVPSAPVATDDRVGIGFDVHAFADAKSGRALVLGGVTIPFDRGLEGHSDADVLTHALMDAMLGALALGDIGKLFPDTDEKYRGISSMKLLGEVRGMVESEGYIVYNADMTIVAERPRMAEHIDSMRDSIAGALGVPRDRIGVKATTTEGLGFTGREQGIGAQAIIRLIRG